MKRLVHKVVKMLQPAPPAAQRVNICVVRLPIVFGLKLSALLTEVRRRRAGRAASCRVIVNRVHGTEPVNGVSGVSQCKPPEKLRF